MYKSVEIEIRWSNGPVYNIFQVIHMVYLKDGKLISCSNIIFNGISVLYVKTITLIIYMSAKIDWGTKYRNSCQIFNFARDRSLEISDVNYSCIKQTAHEAINYLWETSLWRKHEKFYLTKKKKKKMFTLMISN